MDTICNDVCALVTAAFTLTLVRGFRQPEGSFLRSRVPSSRRDQGMALLVFLALGLVEEITASHAGWFNERIVAVCAAGLVAGPWVGLVVSVFVTWLAVAHHGLPLGSIATAMLCGGLVGGLLYRWRPRVAQQGGSEAPISELIRAKRATRKNSQPAAAHRVALKMGRRLSGGCRIGYISI